MTCSVLKVLRQGAFALDSDSAIRTLERIRLEILDKIGQNGNNRYRNKSFISSQETEVGSPPEGTRLTWFDQTYIV